MPQRIDDNQTLIDVLIEEFPLCLTVLVRCQPDRRRLLTVRAAVLVESDRTIHKPFQNVRAIFGDEHILKVRYHFVPCDCGIERDNRQASPRTLIVVLDLRQMVGSE